MSSRMNSMLWFLSFADESGFKGATIAIGNNIAAAAGDAWKNGVNPGGSVLGQPIPPSKRELAANLLHVLVTDKDEAETKFFPVINETEDDDDGS